MGPHTVIGRGLRAPGDRTDNTKVTLGVGGGGTPREKEGRRGTIQALKFYVIFESQKEIANCDNTVTEILYNIRGGKGLDSFGFHPRQAQTLLPLFLQVAQLNLSFSGSLFPLVSQDSSLSYNTIQ